MKKSFVTGKVKNIFQIFFCGEGDFLFRGDLSWEGGCALNQRVINRSFTSKENHIGLVVSKTFRNRQTHYTQR